MLRESNKNQTRRSHSNIIKINSINHLDEGMLGSNVAGKYVVDRTQINRWKANQDVIVNIVAGDNKKTTIYKESTP